MVESGVNRKEAVNALFTIVVAQTTLPDMPGGHIMPYVAAKPDLPERVLSSILIADENVLYVFSLCSFISSQTELYLAIAASHNHGITYQRAAQQCFGSSWVCGTRPLQCERKLQKHSTKIEILGSAPVISHLVPQF